MSPDEIRFLWSLLPGLGVGALAAAAVAWMLLKNLLPGYLVRKGQNLADKEDIAELTHKVEEVKRQHGEILEAMKFRNQLRMAAIDRRLEVHQKAFTLLSRLVKNTTHHEFTANALACKSWWEENCLYLEPAARAAFDNATHAASAHQALLQTTPFQMGQGGDVAKQHMADLTTNWNRVLGSLNVMLESIALPPLSDEEAAALKPDPH